MDTAYGISLRCRARATAAAACGAGSGGCRGAAPPAARRGPQCAVRLDPTFGGQVLGLLGTSDGDPSNDLRTRSGQVGRDGHGTCCFTQVSMLVVTCAPW